MPYAVFKCCKQASEIWDLLSASLSRDEPPSRPVRRTLSHLRARRQLWLVFRHEVQSGSANLVWVLRHEWDSRDPFNFSLAGAWVLVSSWSRIPRKIYPLMSMAATKFDSGPADTEPAQIVLVACHFLKTQSFYFIQLYLWWRQRQTVPSSAPNCWHSPQLLDKIRPIATATKGIWAHLTTSGSRMPGTVSLKILWPLCSTCIKRSWDRNFLPRRACLWKGVKLRVLLSVLQLLMGSPTLLTTCGQSCTYSFRARGSAQGLS